MSLQKLGEWGMRGAAFLSLFVGALLQYWDLNSDTWFILNGGRYVMERGIPHTEPFTMHEGLHFVLEQWLTGVLFWKIYDAFGPMGLLHLTFVIGCVLLYAYYRLCLLVGEGNRQVATFMTIGIGMIACPFFLTTRPQIISTLFFVVEIYLLEQYVRTNRGRWLAPLPVMSVLLVNLHSALWPMMFILMMPFAVSFFAGRPGLLPPEYLGNRFDGRPLLLAAVGSFLAGFCNPYGWEAMAFVFYSYDPAIHGRISEIHPTTVTSFGGAFYFVWMFLVLFFQVRKTMPLQYILLTCGMALLGLMAQRNAVLFFFLGTFPLAYAAKKWKSVLLSGKQEAGSPLRLVPFVLVCIWLGWKASGTVDMVEMPMGVLLMFAVMAICLLLYFFGYVEEGKRFDPKLPLLRMKYMAVILFSFLFIGFAIYYTKRHHEDFGAIYKPTVDFLLERKAPSEIVLWTGFNTGAYPEFRGIRCYVDARPEVFLPSNSRQPHNIIKEYFDVTDGEIYYKDFFRQYHFTHVLTVDADRIIHAMLPYDKDFRLIYEQKDEEGNVVCRLYETATGSAAR